VLIHLVGFPDEVAAVASVLRTQLDVTQVSRPHPCGARESETVQVYVSVRTALLPLPREGRDG